MRYWLFILMVTVVALVAWALDLNVVPVILVSAVITLVVIFVIRRVREAGNPDRVPRMPRPMNKVQIAVNAGSSTIARALAGLIVLSLPVWWFYSFIFAPSHPIDAPQSAQAEAAVHLALDQAFPEGVPRLQFFEGANLDIYITRRAFENVVFPDRPAMIERVGRAWCDTVDQTFFPAVRIRDINAGDVLGRYSCIIGTATMSTR